MKRVHQYPGGAFHFTRADRKILLATLRRAGPTGEKFLSDIEWRVDTYLAKRAIARTEPIPTSGEVRRRIAQLQRIAARLHGLLQEADPAGEVSHLRRVQFSLERRLGAPEALEKALKAFLPIAAAACSDPRPGGRLPNEAEYGLILALAHNYQFHFGKLPPTSPQTSFGLFVTQLLVMIGVDDAETAADRHRLIHRAVEDIRTTPAQLALLKTPSKKDRL
jgi:hypothetical protein